MNPQIHHLQTQYLKAIGTLSTRRKQLADVSVDSSLSKEVQESLLRRLEIEISAASRVAEDSLEKLNKFTKKELEKDLVTFLEMDEDLMQ